jgi:hypothetical protein
MQVVESAPLLCSAGPDHVWERGLGDPAYRRFSSRNWSISSLPVKFLDQVQAQTADSKETVTDSPGARFCTLPRND